MEKIELPLKRVDRVKELIEIIVMDCSGLSGIEKTA